MRQSDGDALVLGGAQVNLMLAPDQFRMGLAKVMTTRNQGKIERAFSTHFLPSRLPDCFMSKTKISKSFQRKEAELSGSS